MMLWFDVEFVMLAISMVVVFRSVLVEVELDEEVDEELVVFSVVVLTGIVVVFAMDVVGMVVFEMVVVGIVVFNGIVLVVLYKALAEEFTSMEVV